jgi:aspartyl-tRNA(Asn)/glutamyl-tRNA(Gln) amidotransferase subunit C
VEKSSNKTGEIDGIAKLLSEIARTYPPIIIHSTFLDAARRRVNAMSLTLSDVKRIANLAQLDMDEAHAETALAELNGIFALAEQMQAVDTSGVEPLAQPLSAILALPLRLREDVVTEENRRDQYQAPAPKTQDGLYLVPKVIE